MALINRISKLFQADIHAVLDNIEEPEYLLKQAIREMQEDLFATEDKINRLQESQQDIEARETQLKKTMAKFKQELDLCFESGKNELARSLIKRQLETEQYCNHLSARHGSIQQKLAELKTRRNENQLQLESMQQKADLFSIDSAAVSHSEHNHFDMQAVIVSADEIEIAFLSEKQRRQ